MPEYEYPLYRPPSEAQSLIFQVTYGCSHNRCLFCYMYKEKQFRVRPWSELSDEIDDAAVKYPGTRKVFLADGDAFALSSGKLARILDHIRERFPMLQRVTAYANPSNFITKSVEEMTMLREKGLTILYYGVESGDPEVLGKIDKGATPDEMAEGCVKATEAGLKLSVTVILGLAGRSGSENHARKTAALINRIQPRYLSALTLMLGHHEDEYLTGMGDGFEFNDAIDDIRELRMLIEDLDNEKCIFRSNHASNYLALAGTLQKDKKALLATIDAALDRPESYLRDEWMRGL
ncbi:MAG: radical SAM protein [Candidatus Krumholzibacteria bacterium]|nr:radical SAM protein [Candidatus Krumholzibacteria bacterium]